MWERLDPPQDCTHPDGHMLVDLVTFGSHVPRAVVCGRCGLPGSVAVFADSDT